MLSHSEMTALSGVGFNGWEILGNNSTNTSYTPVQVLDYTGTANLTNITSISVGDYFAIALKNDGTIWAWDIIIVVSGDNETPSSRKIPAEVLGPGGTGYMTNITAVSCGEVHAMALKLQYGLGLGYNVFWKFR